MNKYEIRVNNATIISEALNEWSAMKQLCLFQNIGDMIDFVRIADPPDSENFAFIYEVELNGQITLAYIKRIA